MYDLSIQYWKACMYVNGKHWCLWDNKASLLGYINMGKLHLQIRFLVPFVGVRNGMWRNTGRRYGSETSFVCAATRFCRRTFFCSVAATRTASVTSRRPHWTAKPTSNRGRWCAALSTWWVLRTVECLLWKLSKELNRSILVSRTVNVMLCVFSWSAFAHWDNFSQFTPKSNINLPWHCSTCMCYVLRCQ